MKLKSHASKGMLTIGVILLFLLQIGAASIPTNAAMMNFPTTLTIGTSPIDLPNSIVANYSDGSSHVYPFNTTYGSPATMGQPSTSAPYDVFVSAVSPVYFNGSVYIFERWSDSGAQSHIITVDSDTDLTANYVLFSACVNGTTSYAPNNVLSLDYASSIGGVGTQRPIQYSLGLYWFAYGTGSEIDYITSPDGSNWSSPQTLTTSNGNGGGFDWRIIGTNVYYVITEENAIYDPAANLMYGRATAASDGSITTPVESIIDYGWWFSPSIEIDSNGLPWVTYVGSSSLANGNMDETLVSYSTSPYVWTTAVSSICAPNQPNSDQVSPACGFPYAVDNIFRNYAYAGLVPASSGNMIVIWQDNDAPGYLYVMQWEGTDFTVPIETPCNGMAVMFAAVQTSDGADIAFINGTELYYANYDAALNTLTEQDIAPMVNNGQGSYGNPQNSVGISEWNGAPVIYYFNQSEWGSYFGEAYYTGSEWDSAMIAPYNLSVNTVIGSLSSYSTQNLVEPGGQIYQTGQIVNVTTNPESIDLSLLIDGFAYSSYSNLTFDWAAGTTHSIEALSPVLINSVSTSFVSWSDSGAEGHDITVSASTASYIASYVGTPAPLGGSYCSAITVTTSPLLNNTLTIDNVPESPPVTSLWNVSTVHNISAQPVAFNWTATGNSASYYQLSDVAYWNGSIFVVDQAYGYYPMVYELNATTLAYEGQIDVSVVNGGDIYSSILSINAGDGYLVVIDQSYSQGYTMMLQYNATDLACVNQAAVSLFGDSHVAIDGGYIYSMETLDGSTQFVRRSEADLSVVASEPAETGGASLDSLGYNSISAAANGLLYVTHTGWDGTDQFGLVGEDNLTYITSVVLPQPHTNTPTIQDIKVANGYIYVLHYDNSNDIQLEILNATTYDFVSCYGSSSQFWSYGFDTNGSSVWIANQLWPSSVILLSQFYFNHWSDNGAISHNITVPAYDETYTAYYSSTPTQYTPPSSVTVTVTTSPVLASSFTVDGVTYSSPQSFTFDVESVHNITALSPVNGYTFLSWSDGGAQSHLITVTGSVTTYTAFYSSSSLPPPSSGGSWTLVLTLKDTGSVPIVGVSLSFNGSILPATWMPNPATTSIRPGSSFSTVYAFESSGIYAGGTYVFSVAITYADGSTFTYFIQIVAA